MCVVLSACAQGAPPMETVCGDGILEGDEVCDDANTEPGDGCDKQCAVEAGFSCDAASPTACAPICGDGLVVGDESCDGSELGGQTCETLNLGAGVLVCGADCQLDPGGCSAYSCGNGALDAGEICDGANVGEHTCQEAGYDGGSLACRGNCTLDVSGCTLATCGNGTVEGPEGCDDGNHDSGDGCGGNCAVEEGWSCEGQPSVCALLCGNGALDPGEQCDGALLGGQDCTTVGDYEGGTLSCGADCGFDTSGCELPTCGNGTVDVGEQCDGNLLHGETCETQGYLSGTLGCGGSCSFDVSGCVPIRCGDGLVSTGEACDDQNTQAGDGCNAACSVEQGWACAGEPSVCTLLCGNGAVDAGEACDTNDLNGQDCASRGFDSGTLHCATDCTFDTSGCRYATCGDGHKDANEDCDGMDLGGATCQSLGYVAGMLGCTGNCGYDTMGCQAPVCGDGVISPSAGEQCDDNDTDSGDGCNAACQVEQGWICSGSPSVCQLSCGNSTWDPGEECDGADLHGATCQTQGFAGGTLACAGSCTFDTSGCQASICGNGTREGSEACDGADLAGQDCTDFGFSGGTLACDGSCAFDTSGCANAVCGNGAVESGEQCDDGNASSGDGCSSTCQWEQTCTADEALSCGGSDHESSDPSGNDVDNYSCSSLGGSDDHVYSFVPQTSGTAHVDLSIDDFDDDYDLFILEGACNPTLCHAHSATSGDDSVSFSVTAGMTYYIVVEEYMSPWYGYRVSLSCP